MWKAAHREAEAAVEKARAEITARCEELGIPARFAPDLGLLWRGRGENAIAERRAELRAVAKSRIAAVEKAAITRIERGCLDAQAQVLAHGLTTASAIAFALPQVEVLMPSLEMASIEEMLAARKGDG